MADGWKVTVARAFVVTALVTWIWWVDDSDLAIGVLACVAAAGVGLALLGRFAARARA